MPLARLGIIGLGLILLWQTVVWITRIPPYILPPPLAVVVALKANGPELMGHAGTTLIEILAGLIIGTIFGAGNALLMTISRGTRHWVMPVLVISQAIPVFALAPILVLWLGYGLSSKIAMAVLIIFFPVTAAFYDGLRRTDPQWLELSRVMDAQPLAVLREIRIPAALPAFASGLRVATAVAPIGAVVGEWVGSSAGLGFYMLHANARMQIDMMFAALALLSIMALTLYFVVDAVLKRLIFWQSEQEGTDK
jgi:putative hydroxymethylpyrimidine transport system permease protein